MKDYYQQLIKGIKHTDPIIGRAKNFNSVVFIPIIKIDQIYYVLFQIRSPYIRQGGEISFPGGQVDAKDKDFKETAIRETMEELGLERNQIEVGGCFGTFVAAMGLVIEVYTGLIHIQSISELKLNKSEVDQVFTLPLSYFMENKPKEYNVRIEVQPHFKDAEHNLIELFPAKELGLPKRYHQAWGHQYKKIYLYQTEYGVIWGITAEIIYEFTKLLG